MTLVYAYQEPKIAWQFTKEREKAECRRVSKATFINAYFRMRENIEKVKERHPEILLHIIVKDYQNNISETHYATENIRLVLPERFTREELEKKLDD